MQEVRDATDTAVGALLELINADQDAGEQYAVIESERFGSTTSKESCEFFLKEKKQPKNNICISFHRVTPRSLLAETLQPRAVTPECCSF